MFLKMVTYGPFPDPQPDHGVELQRIVETGFNAIRIYKAPSSQLLQAASECGLWVFVGLEWAAHFDFIGKSSDQASIYAAAEIALTSGLREWGSHPAVAGVFIANEIPADMVRWMGAVRVRGALEELIHRGRDTCPNLLYAYANFPTTEYLEPNNADFTAINVYLEGREDFASYLPRLHHVAGDRPVVISEFGLDTQRNTEEQQARVFRWYIEECLAAGMAGMTVYAWCDRWMNGGRVMDEWSFGVTRHDSSGKPALLSLADVLPRIKAPEDGLQLDHWPMFSVVVCTHNGEQHMKACLPALMRLDYPSYEVIVVNDGSSDGTETVVSDYLSEDPAVAPVVKLINLQHAGLSAARNRGAQEAKGEIIAYTDDDCEPDEAWLRWLAWAFSKAGWDSCGGPNLPPAPLKGDDDGVDEAVVASAPGAPSHVLLSDGEAEHIPGCNLVVKKDVLNRIGGFDPVYRVAGDDVDFCWRIMAAGYRIGFSGAAFVWHRRRTTLVRYFKQQLGYGKAEALLMKKHPDKFKRGCGAEWKGKVYAGGAMTVDAGSVIYHGSMGTAPYQQLALTMQPARPLSRGYDDLSEARLKLKLAQALQPLVRKWARWRYSLGWQGRLAKAGNIKSSEPSVGAGFLESACGFYADVTYEKRLWSKTGVSRDEILTGFLSEGGKALENDSEWDMTYKGCRLLIACEQHQTGVMVLARVGVTSGGDAKGLEAFSLLGRLV